MQKVIGYAEANSLYAFGIVNAPIRKGKNIEYILWLKREKSRSLSATQIVDTVKQILKNEE